MTERHPRQVLAPQDWTSAPLTAFLEFVLRLIVCGLYPRSFAAEAPTEEPVLARDGANFACWYRHATLEHQDLIPDFLGAVGKKIGDFAGIRFERVGIEARSMILAFRKGDAAQTKYELRLDELSDGQRALLALYALVYLTAGRGCVLFLDEPDNYVALSELQPWLMDLADACRGSVPQAVICSHHPELIDYLGPQHGLLLTRDVTGTTSVRPLADLPIGGALKLSEVVARGWEE